MIYYRDDESSLIMIFFIMQTIAKLRLTLLTIFTEFREMVLFVSLCKIRLTSSVRNWRGGRNSEVAILMSSFSLIASECNVLVFMVVDDKEMLIHGI